MRNCDEAPSRLPRFILGLVKNNRSLLFGLATGLLLSGCYAFVDDETPPEWKDPAGTQQDVAAIAAGSGGPGASVYNAKCAVCHQMTGKGIPNVYPPLAGSQLTADDPALSIRIVLHGFNGPIERNGAKYNGVMQPWKNDLSDQEIADVLTFVRSSWGNTATAVTPEQVKEQREKTKGKVGAYTEEELKSSL
ncbi:MAG: cytochrome c [Bacteroidetes bacterium]|nr:cytochrome c [Bacteroidota bacterium]